MIVKLLRALAFAAEKHKDHRRKDAHASPYINHLITAARILVEEGGVLDKDLIVAAILHDTVEDTETSFDEIEDHFGRNVAEIVREVTDDKTLKKVVRKELQEKNAPRVSNRAKQLMIADKICNVQDIMHNPPAGWDLERRHEYILWTMRVVNGCRNVNDRLDQSFDRAVEKVLRELGLPAGATTIDPSD